MDTQVKVQEEKKYQLQLKRNEDSEWEDCLKPATDFSFLEAVAKHAKDGKHNPCRVFSAQIIDLSTNEAVLWI